MIPATKLDRALDQACKYPDSISAISNLYIVASDEEDYEMMDRAFDAMRELAVRLKDRHESDPD